MIDQKFQKVDENQQIKNQLPKIFDNKGVFLRPKTQEIQANQLNLKILLNPFLKKIRQKLARYFICYYF
jgi:hypothetical protein